MQAFLQFASRHVRSRGRFALAVLAISNQFGFAALAAGPSLASPVPHLGTGTPLGAVCSRVSDASQHCGPAAAKDLLLSVPPGMAQCPDSGSGAACTAASSSAQPAAGASATPDGTQPCPVATGATVPTSPATCTNVVLPVPAASSAAPSQAAPPLTAPSVPVASLQPLPSVLVDLTTSAADVTPGQPVTLTATASATMTNTNNAIEIFDETTGRLVAICTQGSQCIVSYTASAGKHVFAAFVTAPTTVLPVSGTGTTTSTSVAVNWAAIKLTTQTPVVGPGRPVTLTATSTSSVDPGYQLQFFDATSNARLTYCSHGTACTVSLKQAAGGVRTVVAALAKPSSTLPAQDALAQSDPLSLTWLAVAIDGSTAYALGSSVSITAKANVDLSNTQWAIGILDEQGHLVSAPCKSASECSVQVNLPAGQTPSFSAAIGQVPPTPTQPGKLGRLLQKVAGPGSLVNIQARSSAVRPQRLLWGVDSCKAFTDDPNGSSGLYPQVASSLGTPDFWGRYLTNTVCPALSPAEISAAHKNHMGILPIYNDYNCSNVAGYDTGMQYAAAAAAAAVADGIPSGRGLAIDIEPPGDACPGAANLDTGFLHGWYDGVMQARYVPVYYGDASPGSVFATQWCYATGALPYMGQNSYLWSFEPSLLGSFNRGSAPGFSPNLTGCLGFVHAWQYQISAGSNPDVDQDEATSQLPLWYPS